LSLSKIAVSGNIDAERFITLGSKFPVKSEEGRYSLSFGDVFVVSSLKNFIIEDEAQDLVFMSYKSSPATVSVRVRPTLSLLGAFALAIGIVVGET
jgi:hypothetical protein